ncbi:MAG TPA: DUF998 domain-containing protein [Candidatus Kryptonia bacterium]
MKQSDRNITLIHSYLSMRRIVGILAIGLPFIIVLGGLVETGSILQGSLSSYYYTNMRDFLVGLLFAVAIFLISYKGYELIDDIVTNLSGVFALGIIAYPTSPFSGQAVRVGVFLTPDDVSQYVHLAFSVLFLLFLSFNSIFLFTRHRGILGKEKKKRNMIYIGCGLVMLLSVIAMIVQIAFYPHTILAQGRPVLVFESIALISFGVSWLVKGHTLFRDKQAA